MAVGAEATHISSAFSVSILIQRRDRLKRGLENSGTQAGTITSFQRHLVIVFENTNDLERVALDDPLSTLPFPDR